MSFKYLNPKLRYCRRQLKIFSTRRRIRKWKKEKPHLYKPVDRTVERQHKEIWAPIFPLIDLSYLRVYSNFSGIVDPRYVPQDLYFGIIERVLNDVNRAEYFSHKANIEEFVDPQNAPQTVLRAISGTLMDHSFCLLTRKQARELFNSLREDLILKPGIRSGSGRKILKLTYKNGEYLDPHSNPVDFNAILDRYKDDFALQHLIVQHEGWAKYNPGSVNTLRIDTYRSVKDEKVHVLNTYFMFGSPGSFISNSRMNGYYLATDKWGNLENPAVSACLDKHYDILPFNQVKFKGEQLPYFDRVIELIRRVSSRIPSNRLIGFDATCDSIGNPILLEANVKNVGIDQYIGGPHFGDLTFELIEYLRSNIVEDDYQMLRTK